jgi:hypothetical protein
METGGNQVGTIHLVDPGAETLPKEETVEEGIENTRMTAAQGMITPAIAQIGTEGITMGKTHC